jgi:tetratricopeptide (TPR) repeat protein
MPQSATLSIHQLASANGRYPIRLRLLRSGQPELEAEANVAFTLTAREQEDLRWYMEDYLQHAESVEAVHVEQIEQMIRQRGIELYDQVLIANRNTQAIWYAVREQLADLRIEISAGIAEAAAIPWELMRDPESDSAIAVRVKTFVRVQSNPNISFVSVPQAEDGRIRLLYVVCRPGGARDVPLRAIANRLLQGLERAGKRQNFDITALRPPTFKQLQETLTDAKEAGRPFHIVHFDGHGVHADLSKTTLADWLPRFSNLVLGGKGKHGYLLFEQPNSVDKIRPVPGEELGSVLHDTGVPVLILNACQTAMHEATDKPEDAGNVHDEIRAIGSLSQAVVDQGIPAVLGMRYSVFVATAAQYVGELYVALAKGRGFGHAASEARKHLQRNPERWVNLEAKPLQDWFVPVIYEAAPLKLAEAPALSTGLQPELDPAQHDEQLRRHIPDQGFVGRDETLLMLDRAFDDHRTVLLHAYAGQGKTSTAVEFARWYTQTGGLGTNPLVLFTTFETHIDLDNALNQLGRVFAPVLRMNGIEWHTVNEPDERRHVALQLLRNCQLLWIWDNVETVAGFPAGNESAWTKDEQRQLADFLKQIKLDQASKAKLLLTSRRDEQSWLGGIPYRIRMPPMSRADAAALALDLGKERNLTRDQLGDWQPLLDYCVGNPLTLRVISGQAVNLGLSGRGRIEQFIQAIRDGEETIADADEAEGRDRSLGASLDYGFRHAFKRDELPVIALLHLFQKVVNVRAMVLMGEGQNVLPELQDYDEEGLSSLLNRASDIGFLTPIDSTFYGIHPALPWFLSREYRRHYDDTEGRSSGNAALQSWVKAIGEFGKFYADLYMDGHTEVIAALSLEEDNLLLARRLARQQGWWGEVTYAMQGLRWLYDHQGRRDEWARLVTEIIPDYCTAEDDPVPGQENHYSLVMNYRIYLTQRENHNFVYAAKLLNKKIEFDRRQASIALALPEDVPLDDLNRNLIRNLAVTLEDLGHVLREQNSNDCLAIYDESVCLYRRIGDTASAANAQLGIGSAFKNIPSLRDLDAAETAFRRSLDLRNEKDSLGRCKCILQIGSVHYQRFQDALNRNEPNENLLNHAKEAKKLYQQALRLCPDDTPGDLLGPIHNQLGNLYSHFGQTASASEHYEQAMHCYEQTGDRHGAGQTRQNLAVMYWRAAEHEVPDRRRELLHRAHAYAEAALRDYGYYQGRAADREIQARQLMAAIEDALANQPSSHD